MKELVLNENEINVLNHIAKSSKMDCWFFVNENGETIDLESRCNRKKNNIRMIKQLFFGVTESDIANIGSRDTYVLFNILNRIINI